MVSNFVRAVTFQASCILKSICKGGMTPLLTIIVLWDTRVHIGSFNSHNVTADVKVLVDKFLSSQAIL